MRKKRKGRFEGMTIEIGGVLYKVKYRGERTSKKNKQLVVRGCIDYGTREIELERGMAPSEEIQVMVHELCHGVLETFMPAKYMASLGEIEELIIDPFSRNLTGALRSAGLLKE